MHEHLLKFKCSNIYLSTLIKSSSPTATEFESIFSDIQISIFFVKYTFQISYLDAFKHEKLCMSHPFTSLSHIKVL